MTTVFTNKTILLSKTVWLWFVLIYFSIELNTILIILLLHTPYFGVILYICDAALAESVNTQQEIDSEYFSFYKYTAHEFLYRF